MPGWRPSSGSTLVACGTAMHAGMVGKAAIETLARLPAEVDIASEFRYRDPILSPEDLVIIISQSGRDQRHPGGPEAGQEPGACRCWPSSMWWAVRLPGPRTM